VSPITYVGESVEMVEPTAEAFGGDEKDIPKITKMARTVKTSLCMIVSISNNA
jgi:hypothetical protein